MIENYQYDLRLSSVPQVIPGLKPIHPVGAALFILSQHTSAITAYVDHSTDGTTWTNITSGSVVAKGWKYLFFQSTRKYVRLRISADASEGIRFYLVQPSGAPMYTDLLNGP